MKIPGWSPKVVPPGFWGTPPGICVLANTSGGFAMRIWEHPLRSRALLCGASPLRWYPFIKWTWIRLLLPGTVPGAGGAGQMPKAASDQAEGSWGGWWEAVQGYRSQAWAVGVPGTWERQPGEGQGEHLGTFFLLIFHTNHLLLSSNQVHFGWCFHFQTQNSY